MKLGSVLILPAVALRTTATALRLFAGTGQRLADLISPNGEAAPEPSPLRATRATPASSPVVAPAPVDPVRLDLAGLAARPAPEVVAALDTLGTTELADLYTYESKHRRRPAVLDAITAATAPPPAATDDEDLSLLDDVRVPDELVYSTQTPPR